MASENTKELPISPELQKGIDGAQQQSASAVDKDAEKKAKDAEKKAKKEAKAAQHNASKPKDKPAQQQKQKGGGEKGAKDGPALIAITTKKEDDLSAWYLQVIKKAEFLDYSDVPGFFIMPPASTAVWESIQSFLDKRIKSIKVKNCHFPLVIAEERLATEKEHLEGFAAEVAWITHGGKDKLPQRLAVRPTSETAMYPYFATKIRSHRDLPLKLNQWNNVVRWEFKHPVPFLRSREFYWQEGHTAHLTKEEAATEVQQVLDFYAEVYQELLAVPVVKGTKTENEKFAGALYTTTIEAFIPEAGRGIQAGTSHCLGQHFSKMFNITVEDPSAEPGEKKPPIHVWQNSWGFTTRSIGVMVMVHSDNKGLVIPPRVAEIQVILIPVGITAKTSPEDKQTLYKEVDAMQAVLESSGVRAEVDNRENYTPGFKFADWEQKGVPLRLEFGPKDREKHVVTVSRRDLESHKEEVQITDLGKGIPALLEKIQADLFKKADDEYRTHRVRVDKWEDFVPTLNGKNICLIRHCLGNECEDEIKELSKRAATAGEAEDSKAPSMGAKSLCIPQEQPGKMDGVEKCTNPNCGKPAKTWVFFGRSY